MIVAWTGHRPDLFREPNAAHTAVEAAAQDVVDQGATRFLVGGQRGVDTWATLAAIGRGVPFVIVLPLTIDAFTRDWLPADRVALEQTLEHAVELHIAGGYSQRNAWLAQRCELLVAVWTGMRGGGTAETIEFARAAGTPVRQILLEASEDARTGEGRGI